MNTLPKIILKNSTHRDHEVVQILFEKNHDLQNHLRMKTPMRWSQTMHCWYLPYYKTIKQDLFLLLKDKASLEYYELKEIAVTEKLISEKNVKDVNTARSKELPEISEEAVKKMTDFKYWLRSKRYSESTIGTYTDALKTFLRFYATKPISELDNSDLILFNNEYILSNKLSASYQNQVVNAIKLFFRTVEFKSFETELVHRPKRARVLPNVLSKEETKSLLLALRNIKHKTMLSLIYSCGLRRGELLNLKLPDIDSDRKLVIVRQAKGKKDRIAPLSDKILILLREYYAAYKPQQWLFEGQVKGAPYDERSLASVLNQAVKKAGINKPVTLHWLRHSYATHLLENGTDLRYIQEILGHSSSRTTEIYTHVSNKSIQKIISPFDAL